MYVRSVSRKYGQYGDDIDVPCTRVEIVELRVQLISTWLGMDA